MRRGLGIRGASPAVAVAAALLAVACSGGIEGSATTDPASDTAAGVGASTASTPTPSTEADTPSAPATAGSPGIGDAYFPSLGNGGYDVDSYDLDLRFDPGTGRLDGVVTIEATASHALSAFNLDLAGLEVTEATVGGEPAAVAQDGGELTLTPAEPIGAGDDFTAVVTYGGDPEAISTGVELMGNVGWFDTDGGAFVLSEPGGASSVFPLNDHPLDKARYRIAVTVPDGVEVASNGAAATPEDNGDGTATWRFAPEHPQAGYLLALGIGQLVVEESTSDGGVPIRNAFAEDIAERAAPVFARQGEMVDFFSTVFGPYPFEVYGALVLDVPLGVALETQTMSTFGSDAVDAGDFAEVLQAHELAHQWYGDSVSVARWQDIWLNEGFATYAEWLWQEHDRQIPVAESAAQAHALLAQQGTGDVPPGDPSPEQLFDVSVYLRGGLTLFALRQEIGEEALGQVLRGWASEQAQGNGTTEELVALAEGIAGRQLDDLFQAWLFSDSLPALPS